MVLDGDASNGGKDDSSGSFEKSVDFANYFCTYGYLYHQKDMLTDRHRMESYYAAIVGNNSDRFKGKVVLDVGAGTGILALWAAQAGASRVFAVEATAMAEHARTLVAAHSFEDTVTVIQQPIEDVQLPEKVRECLL